MAYLHPVRLTFAGQFRADVSTVNNDVRHYDNAKFEARFQEPSASNLLPNGSWNPEGTGAFRFIGCTVTGAEHPAGHDAEPTAGARTHHDPVLGAQVAGAADRTSAKLVDIDPQWQLASAPWGLTFRLVSGTDELLTGVYKSHPFRDLWFGRDVNAKADTAASATFQSVLEDVVLAPPGHSPMLDALRAATTGDRLSIRFTTYGYDGDAKSRGFSLGHVVGTIGPYLEGEPESFILGRRFAPAAGFSSYGASISYFSGLLDAASQTLLLDLSNALTSTDTDGTPIDIGRLCAGVLADESILENTPVTADDVTVIGEIDYRAAHWLSRTGGVAALPVTTEQLALAADHPLALVFDAPFNPGGSGEGTSLGAVAIRETVGGLLVGAEPIVLRIDAGERATVALFTSRYGAPVDATVQLRQLGAVPDQSGMYDTPQTSAIPVPDMGVPTEALLVPDSVASVAGRADIEVDVGDPANPRGYIEGQIYLIDYRLPGQSSTSRQPFDFLVVHARDGYVIPDPPEWTKDVQPILTQFANLYPIMSRGFIDLTDEQAVRANAELLTLAFSRPIEDPNHMPVTRDLSGPKRQMLLRWLELVASPPEGAAPVSERSGRRRRTNARVDSDGLDERTPDESYQPAADSKTRFAENFLRGGRGSRPSA